MYLVADSGSTKTDWRLIGEGREMQHLSTDGINPYYATEQQITTTAQSLLEAGIPRWQISNIVFYGAGCHGAERNARVYNALSRVFTQADVLVYNDLTAAARATCGTEAGIACILGTGSNSGLYNGHDIEDTIPNLGFYAGDEGSGSHLGKKLLRGYFYREFPKGVQAAFEAAYPEGRDEIMNRMYNSRRPNVYLASFATFMTFQQHMPYIRELVAESFEEFLRRNVSKYEGSDRLPVHFVGSVGSAFKEVLEEACKAAGIRLGQVVRKPIELLVEYHLQQGVR